MHRESSDWVVEAQTLHGELATDVTHCKYGYPYKKATRLWHNLPWESEHGLCCAGSRCALSEANGGHGKKLLTLDYGKLTAVLWDVCKKLQEDRSFGETQEA